MFALVKNQTVTNQNGITENVEVVSLFSGYTIFEDKNGTQYSPDTLISWSADQKQDAGIYDVAYATRPDDRFYNIVENSPVFDADEKIVKISFGATPKELEDGEPDESGRVVLGLKSQYIAQVKDIANKSLSETDWMLVRKIERSVDVPAEVVDQRAAIIAEANRKEAAISAATTVEELIAAVNSTPAV